VAFSISESALAPRRVKNSCLLLVNRISIGSGRRTSSHGGPSPANGLNNITASFIVISAPDWPMLALPARLSKASCQAVALAGPGGLVALPG
jgi:hypothetical protein